MKDLRISLSRDGQLRVRIPSVLVEGKAHHVRIPTTPEGVRALLRILRARSAATLPTIGTEGSPTQQMVDAWLAANQPKPAPVVPGLESLNIKL